MILMIDGRTDILQYYTKWLENRFREGFLYVRNPAYQTTVHKIILDHDNVDAIMFTSKNYEPALDFIKKIDKEWPCLYHYTITSYGKDIEPGVPNLGDRIMTCHRLAEIVGPEKIFWRYDPVFLDKKHTLDFHANHFELLAENLTGYANRCIYSYVNIYEKVKRHMPELEPWNDEAKIKIAKILGRIAKENRIDIQTCNCHLDLTKYGVKKSGCLTKEIINSALHLNVKDLKPNGTLGCNYCYPVVNIGEYNTCMNKCKYCYASSDFDTCESNYNKHNLDSPYLIGNGTPMDNIIVRESRSIISNELSLFE